MAQLIDSPYQLICEGKADEVFFSRLLKASGRNVNVACPKKEDGGGAGKSGMFNRLIGLQAEFGRISRVVLAIDSDDDPAQALEDACGEFRKANAANAAKAYPVPTGAGVMTPGSPTTAVVLVPGVGLKGCLDALLLPSFEQQYSGAKVDCVNAFCDCVRDPLRGVTRDSKVRLRALIAAAWPKNPGISLSFLLEEKNCPIDLAHASFNPIRNLLLGLFP
jgi:hypothetical protein